MEGNGMSIFHRNLLLALGALALAAAGLAAGLALRPTADEPLHFAPPSAVPAQASLAPNEALVESGPVGRSNALPAAPPSMGTPVAARTTRTVATCSQCGVVESVRAVKVKGRATGVGAVAGGVVGGVVGNNIGHGGGRAAMTVLGAVGGGLAGNEIEKRARSQIVYDVRVRMDDGSIRTLQQRRAPAAGPRVVVQGRTLKTLRTGEAERRAMRSAPARV